MILQLQIAKIVVQKIAQKAGITLRLSAGWELTNSPLSLSDTKVRRLADDLRNVIKAEDPGVSLAKKEVADAKNVRGVAQLMIRKIRNESLDNPSVDSLIAEAQA